MKVYQKILFFVLGIISYAIFIGIMFGVATITSIDSFVKVLVANILVGMIGYFITSFVLKRYFKFDDQHATSALIIYTIGFVLPSLLGLYIYNAISSIHL